jgi:hypothetical protein
MMAHAGRPREAGKRVVQPREHLVCAVEAVFGDVIPRFRGDRSAPRP